MSEAQGALIYLFDTIPFEYLEENIWVFYVFFIAIFFLTGYKDRKGVLHITKIEMINNGKGK